MRELARELHWFQNEDGMWVIHATLPLEQGQLVVKALQAVGRDLDLPLPPPNSTSAPAAAARC